MLTPMLTSQRPNQLILNLRWVGSVTQARRKHSMSEEQPTLKVVDRRPFNPDGTPRELSSEEQEASDRAANDFSKAVAAEHATRPAPAQPAAAAPAQTPRQAEPKAAASASQAEPESAHPGRDPLDDP